MSLMVTEVYDALRAANVPDREARRAAEALAQSPQLDDRLSRIKERLTRVESRVGVLEWMVGTNIALTIAVLVRLLFGAP